MGISFNGHAGAIDWIQSRFQKGKPATLFYDEIRTPTYTDCLNRLFEAVLAGDLAGLYHAGGPRRLSLYQIAQIVNRVGGYDAGAPDGPARRHEAGPIPPRAGNVTMDSGKLAGPWAIRAVRSLAAARRACADPSRLAPRTAGAANAVRPELPGRGAVPQSASRRSGRLNVPSGDARTIDC